jgi:hypothetical protein
MTPHRLRRVALHLPARRSRQNATFIHYQALRVDLAQRRKGSKLQGIRIKFGMPLIFRQ